MKFVNIYHKVFTRGAGGQETKKRERKKGWGVIFLEGWGLPPARF